MLNQTQKTLCPPPARFDIHEPQRYISIPEASRLARLRSELSPSARLLFYDLITFRTPNNLVIASKKNLLRLLGIGSHHTLDTRLDELAAAGLIRMWKTYSKTGPFHRPKVRHFISFPNFEKSLPTWNCGEETQGNTLHVRVCHDQNPDEPRNGRELADSARQESYGIRININPDIPAAEPPSFPQSDPEPPPVSSDPTEERREEKPETAVFLTDEPESEVPMTGESVKPLSEDQEKTPAQVNEAIQELVTTIRREKAAEGRVKTLADDVVVLKKRFGAPAVLTGIRCMMETLPTVRNPGGWLRVHLGNPAWLTRFRTKLEERAEIAAAHERNYRATQARIAAEARHAEVEERERGEVERRIAALPEGERAELFTRAREILTAKRGIVTERTVAVLVRLLARERYLTCS